MEIAQLTHDSLKSIINGVDVDKPVLQILGSKRINPGSDATERYRLLVSDGKNLQSFAMLATQMNELYHQGKLSENTIIRVERYITSMVNRNEKGEKRVLIILDLTVLNPGSQVGKKIGNPITLDGATPVAKSGGIGNGSEFNQPKEQPKPLQSFNNTSSSSLNTSASRSTSNGEDMSTHLTHPINALTPYQNKWVIRARVMTKSAIRTWSNAKGEGKLFSMDLCDESGEIKATVFREMVDKFYDMIEVDKVYFISRGQLKVANKQYSTLKNDYEMTFSNETVVQECVDKIALPEISYNFVPISQIGNMEPNAIVDLLGVCKDATELQTFTAKSTGRELKKRELVLVDSSGASINLTLWGQEAENFDHTHQPIILVKGGKIGEFGGGKNVSISGGGSFKVNPDLAEGHKLRGWFDNGGCEQTINSLSTRTGGSSNYNTEWMTFEDVRNKKLGHGDNAEYYQVKGVVYLVKNTNTVYKACPQPDCNKKVTDQENGQFRCEKCNADFNDFKYRLLLNMHVADSTSNQLVTCFNELGEQIMGKTAQEIGQALSDDPDSANNIFSSIYFKQFVFKLRTKAEYYSDVLKDKVIALSAQEVDHDEYQKYLIKDLQELTGIGNI